MPNVAAVRLTYNPRVLWFDPNGIEFSVGDALIVAWNTAWPMKT